MEVFIAIGAAQAFYLIFLLLKKKNRQLPDYILASFFFVLGIGFSLVYLSYRYEIDDLRVFLWNISMLFMPFLFLYTLQLTKRKKRIKIVDLAHFIPWFLSSAYLFWLISMQSKIDLVILFNNSNFLAKPIVYLLFHIYDFLIIPVYSYLIFKNIRNFKSKVKSNYSYSEHIDLFWIRNLIFSTIGIWLLFYAFYISSSFKFVTEEDAIKYGFSLASVLIFYIGYYGSRQKNVFFAVDGVKQPVSTDDNSKNVPPQKYKNTGLTAEKSKVLMGQIDQFMSEGKPYLDAKLSIHQLSELTNINTHHISQAINEISGHSFFNYVNTYRVNAFVEKIKENQHEKNTLLGLAYDCGFNSKSSFNRIFKAIKGVSPTEFIKSL